MNEYGPIASLIIAAILIGSGLFNDTYKETARWALWGWVLFVMIGLSAAAASGNSLQNPETAVASFVGATIGVVLIAWLFHAIRRLVLYIFNSIKPGGTA